MPVNAKKLTRLKLLTPRCGQVCEIDRKTKKPRIVKEWSQQIGETIEVAPDEAERMLADNQAELIGAQ